MDKPGLVIEALDGLLSTGGLVLDVGAGDGFTAKRLTTVGRRVIALEPAAGMIRRDRNLLWVRGDAAHLPFKGGIFDGAYATWAYFFSRRWDPTPGIAELHRVVGPGGPLIVVDNAGGDEFSAMALTDISADPAFWTSKGFTFTVIETEFVFESVEAARRLLRFYFGDGRANVTEHRVGFNVAVFTAESRGPEAPTVTLKP